MGKIKYEIVDNTFTKGINCEIRNDTFYHYSKYRKTYNYYFENTLSFLLKTKYDITRNPIHYNHIIINNCTSYLYDENIYDYIKTILFHTIEMNNNILFLVTYMGNKKERTLDTNVMNLWQYENITYELDINRDHIPDICSYYIYTGNTIGEKIYKKLFK